MSPSDIKVRVASADPLAELTVVDAQYRVRAKGVGTLEHSLPPGLYLARAHSGDVTRQQALRITEETVGDQEIRFEEIGDLQSSAPLDGSTQLDQLPSALMPAQQSWVLLALRAAPDKGEPTSRRPLPPDAARGLALCSLDGEVIQPFDATLPTATPSGHRAVVVPARPGWYALAIPDQNDQRLLLALRVETHWSPTVFLEIRLTPEGPRPETNRLLVSYDASEWGIHRDPRRLRAIELARRSLALGRDTLTPGVMQVLYEQKFHDPMLGLLAIGLLLQGKGRSDHLQDVLVNTGSMIGHDHPDLVIARAVARRDGLLAPSPPVSGDETPLVAPPLLRGSWDRLLTLKTRRKEFARRSPLASVASNLVRSDVWLLWRASSLLREEQHWVPAAQTPRPQLDSVPALLVEHVGEIAPPGRTSRSRDPQSRRVDALLQRLLEKATVRTLTGRSELEEWHKTNQRHLTLLEDTIVNACIQLARYAPRQSLPIGYGKTLAKATAVPLPLLRSTVSQLLRRIQGTQQVVGESSVSTPSGTVLLVGDQDTSKDLLKALNARGMTVHTAHTEAAALAELAQGSFDVALLDLAMPMINGVEFMSLVSKQDAPPEVIVLSDPDSSQKLGDVLRMGECTYLARSMPSYQMEMTVAKAAAHAAVRRENLALRAELRSADLPAGLIAVDPAMRNVFALVEQIAASDAPILITGESGVGKSLLARAVHDRSLRRSQAFVRLNCAAIPEPLFESELFGHEKGAFTGAIAHKRGRAELAHRGTLLLEEVDSLSLSMQAKLLRLVQDKQFTRVGGTEPTTVDLRLVTATNRDLSEAVATDSFREDLYYRLSVLAITIPPLRDRPADILPLAEAFLDRFGHETRRPHLQLSDAAKQALLRHRWPGNVRELQNCIERVVVTAGGPVIEELDLPLGIRAHPWELEMAKGELPLAELERQYILNALKKHGGDQRTTAKVLGIDSKTLRKKLGTAGTADEA